MCDFIFVVICCKHVCFVLFSLDKQGTRNEELKRAAAVVLTYACDEPVTFERLSTYWLLELRRLEVGVCFLGLLFLLAF